MQITTSFFLQVYCPPLLTVKAPILHSFFLQVYCPPLLTLKAPILHSFFLQVYCPPLLTLKAAILHSFFFLSQILGLFAGRLKSNENFRVHYRLHLYPLVWDILLPLAQTPDRRDHRLLVSIPKDTGKCVVNEIA